MKAFLLAAGKGTRLQPLTDTIPKCMVPICGKPLLEIWLDMLTRAGVTDVLINVHHHASLVIQFLEKVTLPIHIRIFEEPELLGSAKTVHVNRDFISDVSDFFIIYSDNLTTLNLNDLLAFHRHHSGIFTMALAETDKPHMKGIVTVDENNLITSFEEKPAIPKSNVSNTGIYVCDSGFINYIDSADDKDLGYDVLPKLVGHMRGYMCKEYFRDIGTPEDYQKAQQEWEKANQVRQV